MAKCMYPYMVERKLYHNQKDRYVPVPCGKCPNCLKRRTAMWSFRLVKEAEKHICQFFVTLTYNPEHVPISPNGFMELCKDDLQRFMKRLRRRTGAKIKYYAVGEYGTQYKRPHYHLILFTDAAVDEYEIVKSWISPLTNQPYGDVHFGTVEYGSVIYTVQYFDKGEWKPMHERDDRQPEFAVMSKGLGGNFLSEETVSHYLKDPTKSYIVIEDGKKIPLPKFYVNKLYQTNGTFNSVASHPSVLHHFEHNLVKLEERHKAISAIMEAIPEPEIDAKVLHERRKAAIHNYRQSKRKTRK